MVNVTFLEREFKSGALDTKGLNFLKLYLLADRNQHSSVWREFRQLIREIDAYEG